MKKAEGKDTVSDIQIYRAGGPRIVVIGGGTGLSTMLRGLKECSENITAIVTVSDDGGGSGMLRNDLGMLPPGDIRSCILALANMEPTMQSVLNYRFSEGILAGQSFGNLFLAALNGVFGSFEKAVSSMSEVLAVTGRVLPVTTENVYLEAEFENGARVLGESKIRDQKLLERCRIKKVSLIPQWPDALDEALEAIRQAHLIVLGPGSLYTSIVPNLLVRGVAEAICASAALKVYVVNVMSQRGETEEYTVFDHVQALLSHACPGLIDICLANETPVPAQVAARYALEGSSQTFIDAGRFRGSGIELVSRPLIATKEYARHDPRLLAYELLRLFTEYAPRPGRRGKHDVQLLRHLKKRIDSEPV